MNFLILSMLSLGITQSTFAAQEKLLQNCYIQNDGSTISVKLFFTTENWTGFEDLKVVKIQSGQKDSVGNFIPQSQELSYEMKLILNFHKGAVYDVDIKWPTGNPGALFYDAGSESVALAFYRTQALGSINGTGKCGH